MRKIRSNHFLILFCLLLTACAPVTGPSQVTVTLTPPTPRLSPTPIPILVPPEATATAEVASVVADLDYDAKDHASFAPENYMIRTQEWQGQNIQVLIHVNPETKAERIDGMEVTINGEKQWVRGLWYETAEYPGSGGFVLDMLNTPTQDTRYHIVDGADPNDIYGELLRAVAHQRGIPYDNVWEYIQSHDYKVSVRLPENANPGSKVSPSQLRLSPLTEVDFAKPFVNAYRGDTYAGADFNGADVPEQAMYLVGDSDWRNALFVVDGQLHFAQINYTKGGFNGTAGYRAGDLFTGLEMLAGMQEGFVDSGSGDNSFIRRATKGFREGNTIVNSSLFFQQTPPPEFKIEYSIFELR